jgi:hypothetical protein
LRVVSRKADAVALRVSDIGKPSDTRHGCFGNGHPASDTRFIITAGGDEIIFLIAVLPVELPAKNRFIKNHYALRIVHMDFKVATRLGMIFPP